MKFVKQFTSWLPLGNTRAKYAIWAGAAVVIVVSAGTASAALGGPSVRSLLSLNSKPAKAQHQVEAKRQAASPTPTPSTSTTVPTPEAPKTAAAPAYGVTVSGNNYGQHLANEPTATIWSSKPLVLSTYSISIHAGTTSPTIVATSPDGYPLCLIAGLGPGQNMAALNIGSTSCGPSRDFVIQVPSSTAPGTYTLHVEIETAALNSGPTRYVHYDGYIAVTVTPYVPPYPTMTPYPTITP
jgi:hypothetical protein